MNEPIISSTPSYDFKLIAPYSLEECRHMVETDLENRIHQQLGLDVVMVATLVNVDLESSYFLFRMQELLKGQGYLRRHSPYTTYVYGYIFISQTSLYVYGVLLAFLVVLSGYFLSQGHTVSGAISVMLALFLGAMFLRDFNHTRHYKRDLIQLLHQMFRAASTES